MIPSDSESYSAELQLLAFYHIWKLVMWSHSWSPNCPYVVFVHFLVKPNDISFLGYMQRTLTWTLTAVHTLYVPSPFFCCFVYYKHLNCLFWTFTLNPENSTRQYQQPFLSFSDFSLFYSFFYVEMQIFPYLEMYTGPWKQYPPPSSIPHFSP